MAPPILNDIILPTFREIADPHRAQQQKAYLKNQFEFLGLSMPEVRRLSNALIKEHQLTASNEVIPLMLAAIRGPFREIHHFAINLAIAHVPNCKIEFSKTLTDLITTNSWWDSVDALLKAHDRFFQKFPEREEKVTAEWMATNNIWLQRSAVLYQLLRKDNTNTVLLERYLAQIASSDEFFLQKAAGWALRQYARTDRQWVETLLNRYSFSKLTVREATKHFAKA